MDSKLRPETLCIQAGYTPKNGEPRQVPIYPVHHLQVRHQRATWASSSTWRPAGYFYTRLAESHQRRRGGQDRGAGGRHGGHAHLLRPGGQLLSPCSTSPAAATTWWPPPPSTAARYNLFAVTMKRMGIEFTFVEPGLHRRGAGRRLPPQHQGRVRRDHRQPGPDGAGHRELRQGRPRATACR